MKSKKYDMAIIGGGPAGLTSSVVSGGLGARTITIEKSGRLGGECSWNGCVPSKVLIHIARLAHEMRKIGVPDSFLDDYCARAMDQTRQTTNEIAVNADEHKELEHLGAEVVYGSPKFTGRNRIEVDGEEIYARRAIICTGSLPVVPDIPGLKDVDYKTNESIFDIEKPPESITMIGGGPIGVELAQAFRRLGSKVVIIGRNDHVLPKDDKELTAILADLLREEGIQLYLGSDVTKVEEHNGLKRVHFTCKKEECLVDSEMILVATGRYANVTDLGLENIGVEADPRGLKVNGHLKTDAGWVYGAGDCIGGYRFSHVAEYEGMTAVRNAFFPLKQRTNYKWIPWATFTDPELASLGPTEGQLKEKGINHRIYRKEFSTDDRANTDLEGKGIVKLLSTPNGRLLGAQILGPRAGELMGELIIAAHKGASMSDIYYSVHIYPTLTQAVQHTAAYWFAELGDKPWFKTLVRMFTRKT